MAIDFHNDVNRYTYSGRRADVSWRDAMEGLLGPATGLDVVDIGCGGGTYSHAWLDMGARTVIGVDSSRPILSAAIEAAKDRPELTFMVGDACATGLADDSADLVFARALIHHLPDPAAAAAEAHRLLRPGGTYLVQDRTVEDVRLPGKAGHPRGWFFDAFPRLMGTELARRPTMEAQSAAMHAGGFAGAAAQQLWERRRLHTSRAEFLAEISARTGRSLLHDLDEGELAMLVTFLSDRLPDGPVSESDRWTLWSAQN